MKKNILIIVIILFNFFGITCYAQEPEDIVAKTDDFENLYFESLKHKGMENYDLAIESLKKCLALKPQSAEVLFELGKNYLFQKNYKDAYENFEKSTKIEPKNRWAWVGMYDVCYDTRDFNQAIIIVEKLVDFKIDYKEDLASLYMNTQQYDKALTLINELNNVLGKSEKRDNYKMQILQDPKYQGSERENLIAEIKKNPKEEQNYISLIHLYSKSNQEEKALEIAKQLEVEIPTSDWAQVSLFKFHLSNNDGAKAVKSMNTVLSSDKIDTKIKHRVLNEFLIFTKTNPQFDADLDKAISYFDNDKEVKVAKEIGKFYQNKKEWNKAAKYYELHLKSSANDLETILLTAECYKQALSFEKLDLFCDAQIQLFPTQPEMFYCQGFANNKLKKYKKAKDILESGIDFVIDNQDLLANFNLQLSESYAGLGDIKKKELYSAKANMLLKNQK